MGIDPSVLSKFMTGARVSCNPETLERICEGISANRTDRATLLAAYLDDQKVGTMRDLVEIRVRNGVAAPKAADDELSALCRQCRLDHEAIDAIRKIIRTIPSSRALRRTLIDISHIASDITYPDRARLLERPHDV
jgi:hypothetical protein